MQLSTDIRQGLSHLGDDKIISNNVFKEIVDYTFVTLTTSESKQSDHASLIAALSYVIYEGAKLNYKALELGNVLEEDVVKQDRVKYICEGFEGKKSNLRNAMNQSSFHFPHLIDLDWRLDYIVKTSDLQKTDETLYTIQMKLSDGKTKIISCTLSELLELSSKLNDATKQVERYLTQ
jgi:hypothetical protein